MQLQFTDMIRKGIAAKKIMLKIIKHFNLVTPLVNFNKEELAVNSSDIKHL